MCAISRSVTILSSNFHKKNMYDAGRKIFNVSLSRHDFFKMSMIIETFISSGISSIKQLLMMFITGTIMTSWHCFTKCECIVSRLLVFDGDLLSSCMVSSRVIGTKLDSWQSFSGRSVRTMSDYYENVVSNNFPTPNQL